MKGRQRPTQQSAIARSFGGRSPFVSEELDTSDVPGRQMSRWERTAAWLTWHDSHNHYEEYADDSRVGFNRLVPSTELVVAAAIVVLFFGSYAAFIAYLALSR
jgi:hypothetical protein